MKTMFYMRDETKDEFYQRLLLLRSRYIEELKRISPIDNPFATNVCTGLFNLSEKPSVGTEAIAYHRTLFQAIESEELPSVEVELKDALSNAIVVSCLCYYYNCIQMSAEKANANPALDDVDTLLKDMTRLFMTIEDIKQYTNNDDILSLIDEVNKIPKATVDYIKAAYNYRHQKTGCLYYLGIVLLPLAYVAYSLIAH